MPPGGFCEEVVEIVGGTCGPCGQESREEVRRVIMEMRREEGMSSQGSQPRTNEGANRLRRQNSFEILWESGAHVCCIVHVRAPEGGHGRETMGAEGRA